MTHPLIRTLRLQHFALLRLLADLKDDLAKGDATALDRLQSFKTPLLEHLSLEDETFYPALRALAEDDPERVQALAGLRTDLARLMEEASAFFDACAAVQGGPGPELHGAFLVLADRLRERMALEETELYLAFDQVHDPDETLH